MNIPTTDNVVGSLLVVFDRALRFPVLVAALERLTLIVRLLALADRDHDFDMIFLREHTQRDDAAALLFFAFERGDLLAASQKFARLGVNGAGTWITLFVELEAKAGVVEPELTAADRHKRAFELHVTVARSTHFWSCQHDTGL